MVETMTAVWLIILTILVCAAVPGVLIWLTSTPSRMLLGLDVVGNLPTYEVLQQPPVYDVMVILSAMPMAFEGSKRKRNLLFSMLVLAGLIGGAVLGTAAFTMYFRSQDPVNQCIDEPESQPFQLSVPITVIEDGIPALVPRGIGIEDNCIRPVHTIEENLIHVAYNRPHDFTLGHFLYYWLGNDLLKYDTKVYVNGIQYTEGDLRDIVLGEGDSIRIEFATRN